MRRIISILLVAMLVLSFVGCDTKDASSGKSSHEHNYTKEEVIIEVRCNQEGKVKCECECGNSILKDIDKLSEHKWQDATCVKAKTCVWCGLTEGELVEHNWEAATCTKPKICKICAVTEGNVLRHSFVDDKCTVCGSARDVMKEANNCSLTLEPLPHIIEFRDAQNGAWGRLIVDEIRPYFTVDSKGYINITVDLSGTITGVSENYSCDLVWEIYSIYGLVATSGKTSISEKSNKRFTCKIIDSECLYSMQSDSFKLVLKPV